MSNVRIELPDTLSEAQHESQGTSISFHNHNSSNHADQPANGNRNNTTIPIRFNDFPAHAEDDDSLCLQKMFPIPLGFPNNPTTPIHSFATPPGKPRFPGPTYALVGLIILFPTLCSLMCAHHPAVLATTNKGVKNGIGTSH